MADPPSFPPPPPVAPAPRGGVATFASVLRAVWKHLDRLISRDVALGVLAGTATTLLLALVADAGQLAMWLGALGAPFLVQEVRWIARDWSRSKTLPTAAFLAFLEGLRSGKLGRALGKAVRAVGRWASGHVAPAAVASGVTIGGFTVVTAALELPNPFFDEVRMAVLGFSVDDSSRLEEPVDPGGTIRACDVSTFYAHIRADDVEQGARWVRRWEVDDELFAVRASRWRGDESSTEVWGPFYTRDGTEPTGESLPGGVWVLTIRLEGETLDKASIRLINDAC